MGPSEREELERMFVSLKRAVDIWLQIVEHQPESDQLEQATEIMFTEVPKVPLIWYLEMSERNG